MLLFGVDDVCVCVLASRLGRRPKRLKNSCVSESVKPVKAYAVAPQPTQLGLLPLSVTELEVVNVIHLCQC